MNANAVRTPARAMRSIASSFSLFCSHSPSVIAKKIRTGFSVSASNLVALRIASVASVPPPAPASRITFVALSVERYRVLVSELNVITVVSAPMRSRAFLIAYIDLYALEAFEPDIEPELSRMTTHEISVASATPSFH